jgi:ABC-2 type transport system permease protein
MRELWIVMQREFRARVRTRSFFWGTVLTPLIFAGIFAVPTLLSGGGAPRTFALVDEAPAGVGAKFIQTLTASPRTSAEIQYRVARISGTFAALRSNLNHQVVARLIDGYVVLPADILDQGRVIYRAQNVASVTVIRDLQRAADRATQTERLRRSGVDSHVLASIIQSTQIDSANINQRGQEQGSAFSTFLFAYMLAILLYMLTFLYGIEVMRSALEEKSNRIAEVLVGSVRPGYLLAGKVLGVGATSLLQILIWVIFALVTIRSSLLTTRLGIAPQTLSALAVEPAVGAAFLGFFILGYLVYSSLFATLGASVTSEQEAQSLIFLIILPLLTPLLYFRTIIDDPLGKVATWLGLLPLTSPIAMPMRMASGTVPWVQVVGSLALLLLSLWIIAWIAGKIYRVGMLSTGKKATLRELGRWLRAS